MDSLQGHFLVAAPHQLDPNFVQTVVLAIQHADRGAFGVILNYPREHGGKSFLEERRGRHLSGKARLYLGGPVTGPLMAVHTDESLAEIEILPGVFFTAEERDVLRLMRQTDHLCKVFTGYVGWGARQLEYEVEHGVWRAVPATLEQIFSHSAVLWQGLHAYAVELQLQAMFHLKYIPSDPLLN